MSTSAISAALIVPQPIAPAPTQATDTARDTNKSSSATKAADRPHDGDSDDKTAAPSSPVALTSRSAQTALAALKVGG